MSCERRVIMLISGIAEALWVVLAQLASGGKYHTGLPLASVYTTANVPPHYLLVYQILK